MEYFSGDKRLKAVTCGHNNYLPDFYMQPFGNTGLIKGNISVIETLGKNKRQYNIKYYPDYINI